MKKQPRPYTNHTIAIIFYTILLCSPLYSQTQINVDSLFGNRGEIIFSFIEPRTEKMEELSRIVSIDSKKGSLYTAYANKSEFIKFCQYKYPISIHEKQNPKSISMATTLSEMENWDRYPTYDVYIQMMQNYATTYPQICKLDTIGSSVNNRLILALKISENAFLDVPKPEFFYSSSIHGDEVTGYYFMLRLIDMLVTHYNTDSSITQLIRNTQIYINPLANPDGTYAASNNTISGATRYNAHYVDLNRNYPDHWSTEPLDAIQPENIAMMEYVANHRFVMAANLHGGTEVINFPWDSFNSSTKKHADYSWWTALSKRFIETCRTVNSDAYTCEYSSGYVHGGDWYVVHNGRQDYMNYFQRVRELTLEVSKIKTLSTSNLRSYWNTQHQALINYIKEVHQGINGKVVDSLTREPLQALITVENYDKDQSEIYSSATFGDFYRPINEGSYTLKISADGYKSKKITVSTRFNHPASILVALTPGSDPVNINNQRPEENELVVFPNPCSEKITLHSIKSIFSYQIRDLFGNIILSETNMYTNNITIYTDKLPKGIYFIETFDSPYRKTKITKFIKK